MKNLIVFLTLMLSWGSAARADVIDWSHQAAADIPAAPLVDPTRAPILAAVRAGDRIVAVGEYGSVLLVDGDRVHQAAFVPTRAPLTAVFFLDAKQGWAVGAQRVILHTADGGEHWTRQPIDGPAEALFSVWFENAQHGFAGGRFSTLLETLDGGRSWHPVKVSRDPDAEQSHLFDLFGDARGRLYATSEFGQLFVSADAGQNWNVIETGFGGSLWSGVALPDDSLVVVGMVGTIMRSGDGGESWQKIDAGTRASFTDIRRMADGSLVAVGFNGVVATSRDNGRSFSLGQRPGGASLTAVAGDGKTGPVLFSTTGVVGR